MRSICPERAAALALVFSAALASAGCPELNRQPEKPVNPLFSVDDPAGRQALSLTDGRDFPDRARRAQ
jgi:hypothetical protein